MDRSLLENRIKEMRVVLVSLIKKDPEILAGILKHVDVKNYQSYLDRSNVKKKP